MKKIILSVAVAAMALSTTASALEDIKVNGQAKLWYEANDKGDNSLFNKEGASAEVIFKLGMTGKQGDVGFGAEVTQGSTMGLENVIVTGTRSAAVNEDMYVSKAYFTAPMGGDTTLKMGRQELNTPFAFTEKWNAVQNNFDAAVIVNNSVENLTLIGAFVGQGNGQQATHVDVNTTTDTVALNTAAWKAGDNFNQLHGGAFAVGALYKADAVAVNVWGYHLKNLDVAPGLTSSTIDGVDAVEAGAPTGYSAQAFWIDAAVTVADVNIKAYAATVMSDIAVDDTVGVALSVAGKAGDVKLFAAGSMIMEDGGLPIANVATNFKKTKLPTAGVYTDGLYVAQVDSMAFKVKAAGKIGSTGLALQAVINDNDSVAKLETTEVDLIVTQKLGDFNLKGILMHRSFDDKPTDDLSGGIYARVVASVNF